MSKQDINFISVYAGLLPVIAGIITLKKNSGSFRLLLLLFIYAFLTDYFVGYFYVRREINAAKFIFNIYSPIEAGVFSFFIYSIGYSTIVKRLAITGFFIFLLAWLVLDVDLKNFVWKDNAFNGLFVTSYEIVIAALSAVCLLHITTVENRLINFPLFWMLLGLFIYCFSTLFINALVETNMMSEIWYIHNVVNILTQLIFTWGFLSLIKPAPTLQHERPKLL